MNINYENITLTPISESDLELLRTWRNDRQLCKYLRDIGYISKQDQYNWYLKQKGIQNKELKDVCGTHQQQTALESLKCY